MKDFGAPRSLSKPAGLSREAAESLAVEGLTFLASDRGRLERFLSLSGLDLDNLRAAAADPGFLAAVLDHLAGDEGLLLAFATNGGHDPDAIARARGILSPDPDAS